MQGLRSETERLNRAGAALGGRFGEVAGRMDALSGAMELGASKTALLAGGVLAAGLGVAKFGSHVVDTISNIDGLSESLSKADQERLKPFIGSATEASASLDRFETATTKLSIVLAGTFAPVVEQIASDLTSLTDNITLAVSKFDELRTKLRSIGQTRAGRLIFAGPGAPGTRIGAPDLGVSEVPLDSPFGESPILPGVDTGVSALPEPSSDPVVKTQVKRREETDKLTKSLELQAATVQGGWEAMTFAVMEADEAIGTQMLTAEAALPAIGDLLASTGDMIAQGIITAGEGSKEAMRDAAIASKSFAVLDVGVKTSQAIMAALTIPPPAGPVLAAIAGATGGIQAALVASTPLPSFHTGGLQRAPDGSGEGVVSSRILPNEVQATLTPEALRALGGADGIARRNAGTAGMGGGDTYLVLNDRVMGPLRGMAKPDAGFGQRRR